MTADPYPDLELALLDVAAAILGLNGGTVIPADLDNVMPYVFSHRHGGTDDGVTDRPAIDIDVFAETRDAARTIAEQLRQEYTTRPHQTNGVVIDRVVSLSGPKEVPYGAGKRRFTATYAASARR